MTTTRVCHPYKQAAKVLAACLVEELPFWFLTKDKAEEIAAAMRIGTGKPYVARQSRALSLPRDAEWIKQGKTWCVVVQP